MKTTIFNVKIDRKIHKLDAADQAVGRLASQTAHFLSGKNKVNYTRQLDTGDFVEVTNIDKLKFTGKKLEQKKYYHYSGYPGGLKTKLIKDLLKTNPKEILRKAVYNMLPKNKLRESMIKRLIIK